MRFPRSCGTLVHPTSFPSKYGIGDFGNEAKQFIDFLQQTGQSIWQVLPLGPTGFGNSPYASYSAFAGNHFLISLDILVGKGLLTEEEVQKAHLPFTLKADYENSYRLKRELLEKASDRFYSDMNSEQKQIASHGMPGQQNWPKERRKP